MNNKEKKDIAGVIAPPPLIFTAAYLLGYALHWQFPISFVGESLGNYIGSTLLSLGLVFFVSGVWSMKRAKTHIDPGKPTTKLVNSGIFRFSRNPLYVSLTLVYVGLAFVLNQFWPLATLLPALILLNYGVIHREEKYLERLFGDEYVDYKSSVRRWI